MNFEKLVHKATAHGNSIGQTALAEFILKSYKDEISPKLTRFLERLLQGEYENIGNNLGQAGEDVATQVHQIMEERVN
jgi:hypothetical protein